MRVLEFWGVRSRIIFIILLLPLLFLSWFSYFFYKLLILIICLFIVYGLVRGIMLGRNRQKATLVTSIFLVVLWAGYCIIPEFNFWLTSSARQGVVERLISDRSKNARFTENLLLGKATFFSDNSVYFDYYKRGHSAINQAAFFVYKSNPNRIETDFDAGHTIQLKRLKYNWFFFLRGYAD